MKNASKNELGNNEFNQLIRQFHKFSDRHVLVLEADLSENDKRHIFKDADTLRRCGNELTGIMKRNLEQLNRTKRYRKLKTLYGRYSESGNTEKKKEIAAQMSEMQREYNVTWDFCRREMIRIREKYNVPSIFALTRSEDIWSGVEKVLYSDGKTIHFRKHGNLPNIRAKQIDRGITLSVQDNHLCFSYKRIKFSYTDTENDDFIAREIKAILNYLQHSDEIDYNAVNQFLEDRTCMDTYRPCYATLVCKTIRGKLRVFIHITVEGRAKRKYTKSGDIRHQYGLGRIGCDIGTQTIAYTSDSEVGLKNLAERGNSIERINRQKRSILRKMNRSRKATNPDNYNEDGTIRKGKKVWHYSNHYLKLRRKYHNLCRKSSINRKLAVNEDVNHLRSLGDTFITEPKNFKSLQRKAKPSDKNNNDEKRNKRRKRFGRSVGNRNPGYFHEKAKQVFESTGGSFHEVPNNYRASQYDHTADEYIKKKLNDRMFSLSDGTRVQRDMYSSFLLFCADDTFSGIDKEKCLSMFPKIYTMQKVFIDNTSKSNIKICNSGIKTRTA